MNDIFNHIEQKKFWWATDILKKLGYKELTSFENVIFKSIKTFITLDIPYYENIIAERDENSKKMDYKLSRFACYITVLYSDPKKDEVHTAKQKIGEKLGFSIKDLMYLERASIREELAEANKWLTSIAKKSGVEDFSSFIDSGYIGLYGMSKWQLTDARGQKRDANIQNYMSRLELSLNFLRITQTEELIRTKVLKGQKNLEQVHQNIGRELRNTFKRVMSKNPEELDIADDLEKLKKRMKDKYRELK